MVYLGLLEEATDCSQTNDGSWRSKVGGMPTWLQKEPNSDALTCKTCRSPLLFLCQLYTPYKKEFHRMLYIFCCSWSANCFSSAINWLVIRQTQLNEEVTTKLQNINTSTAADVTSSSSDRLESLSNTIEAAVTATDDWFVSAFKTKAVDVQSLQTMEEVPAMQHNTHHKSNGGLNEVKRFGDADVLPELQIICFEELMSPHTTLDYLDYKAMELLDNYKKREADGTLQKEEEEDMNSFKGATWDNEEYERNPHQKFVKFQKKLKQNPHQILRYDFGGAPLWMKEVTVKQLNSIPTCEQCGAQRVFELQLLPTLPYELSKRTTAKTIRLLNPSFNWGTIVVYSCLNDCEAETTSTILREFVIIQEE